MDLKFKALIALAFIGFIGCEPPVTFNEPQPPDTDKLIEFPKKIQGQYSGKANGSSLQVTDRLIRKVWYNDFKIHPNMLDSTATLLGDTIFDIKSKSKIPVKREGDSIAIHLQEIDTIFKLDDDHVLKKFKGNYYMNTRYSENSWEVKQVEFSDGELTISSISDKEGRAQLKSITEEKDSTAYKFNPTKRQFKRFLRNDGFDDLEIYTKQK